MLHAALTLATSPFVLFVLTFIAVTIFLVNKHEKNCNKCNTDQN